MASTTTTPTSRRESEHKPDDQEQNENNPDDDRIEIRVDLHNALCIFPGCDQSLRTREPQPDEEAHGDHGAGQEHGKASYFHDIDDG